MTRRTIARLLSVSLALALSVLRSHDGACQEIRARVVDERSRSAIHGATATLLAADSSEISRTTSGPDGFFELRAPGAGDYLLRVEHLGYATDTRSVTLGPGQSVIPAFVLRVEAIALDTLEVEVTPRTRVPEGVAGPARPAHIFSGERLATLDHTGVSFFSAVRELSPSVRLQPVMLGERRLYCIESRRQAAGMQGDVGGRRCRNVAIIIDGIDTGMDGEDALRFFQTLRLFEWESVEYLSPVDAGFRYGMLASSRGALVLWSRGMGPHRSPARGGGQ